MYRPVLENLLAFSKGKRILNVSDVARYLGKTRPWCVEHLGVTAEGITVEALAHRLAKNYSGEVTK